ncbi:MAG: hypothetical protein ROW48_06635 [Bellilinea sp.]
MPQLADMLFAALLAGCLMIAPRLINQDGDTGRHIAVGRVMLAEMRIPRADIFSHTLSGEPLTPHEWLAQVIFAAADSALGLAGVVLVSAVALAAAFALTYRQACQRSGMALLSLAITLLGVAAASLHFLARPHIFTLLFATLWLGLMEWLRKANPAPLWLSGLVMLAWANTHGAFLAGFVIWAAYIADTLWHDLRSRPLRLSLPSRYLLGGGGIALLASLLNPVGAYLWHTVFDFLGSRYLVGRTQEYLPPDFQQPAAIPFLIMIALSLLVLSRQRARLPLAHALLLAGWTMMALYSARNIPIYVVVCVPILAQAAAAGLAESRWLRLEERIAAIQNRLRGGLWSALSVVALVAALLLSPGLSGYIRYDARVFPVQAANWVEANPQTGNVFNYFTWGGYLLYRLYPEYRVFIDGQTDFYGEAFTRQYETVITLSPGWEDILARYAVDWAILPADEPLAGALRGAGWQPVYADPTAVILARKQPLTP